MGLILMPAEIKTNMEILRTYLESATECYRNVWERVYEYYTDEELDTKSFRESKNQMEICYRLIAEGMITVQESIIGDIDILLGCIGDEYLDEDELLAQIERLKMHCEQYEEKIRSLQTKKFLFGVAGAACTAGLIERYKEMIVNLKEQIAVLQEKVIFLHEAEDLTVNLFESAISLLRAVHNAIIDGGVNVRTDNGFAGELTWLTDLGGAEVEEVDGCEAVNFSRSVYKGNYPEAYLNLLADYEKAGIVDGRFELYNGGRTIAYGHDVQAGEDFSNGLSMEEGFALMINDLNAKYDTIEYYINVLNNNYEYTIDINEFTDDEILFLLDFTFNRGVGLVKRDDLKAEGKPYNSLPILIVAVSENDYETIRKILMEEICNLEGIELDGLKRRRMDEYEILKLGDYERDYDLDRDYTQSKQ